jgi:prepilin-type N-terminal cleavage/methylation domain-containing protein
MDRTAPKMIYPPKTKSARGFTLLEIVIVLMVFALILGGAITTVVLSSSERALRNCSSDIELLAKKARTAAILHQTPYAIEFLEGSLRVRPFAETTEKNQLTALGHEIGGTEASEETKPSLREEVAIDSDITLSMRRWNSDTFLSPSKELTPIWRFDPDGLTEPVTVRMSIDESYAQDSYHPLTATIIDSELEAK